MWHEVKTQAPFFDAIKAGRKTAEWRVDDRQPRYEVGDWLVHRRVVHTRHPYDLPTWEVDGTAVPMLTRITHLVRSPDFGIPDGYVMLSIKLEALA